MKVKKTALVNKEVNTSEKRLKSLANQFPSIDSIYTEIINLKAILNLPKGTEHFLTDIHGEHESFVHVLKNCSGVIKVKIEELFANSMMDKEKKDLAMLVYYPEQKIEMVLKKEKNIKDWYKINLHRLVELCRHVSSKYTRSKVRKMLPKEFAYIIEELLYEQESAIDKQEYYYGIITTIINIDRANEFIITLSNIIQRLVIDRLHILGDIYDRGPRPDIIMDTLTNCHSVDIQWGNHDIVWIGAASGSKACIANVLRISAKYNNLDFIEDVYGISLLPLATFALANYKDDECSEFIPVHDEKDNIKKKDISLVAKMHKAITIIQFKLEQEIIQRRPEFKMKDRLLLDKINYETGTIELKGKVYELKDSSFPTVDIKNPYQLTKEESILVDKLFFSFRNNEKLQEHIKFLLQKGNIYLKYNSNLLFHACIPMNKDKSFKEMLLRNRIYKGKKLLDKFEVLVRQGYYSKNDNEKLYGIDCMWYLWCGAISPLFGKEAMTTFERYFIKDKTTSLEKKNSYYEFRDDEEMYNIIFKEFDLDSKNSRIINGHIPVKTKDGESPIKANGKLLVIDGGFSKAYQNETGIAGYTLVYNSYGLYIVAHEHFESIEKAIIMEQDILSTRLVIENKLDRKRVRDTDIGVKIMEQIEELKLLLYTYNKN